MRALIVVDVQNDFCPGGTLATSQGSVVAEKIADLVAKEASDYAAVVATKDWHIEPGDHFDTWPVHCVAGSPGAELHPALAHTDFDEVFLKGQYTSAYSGFEGASSATEIPLATWLQERGIETVDVVGIATDYCVKATALDAHKAGFTTRVLKQYCAAVSPDTESASLDALAAAGVDVD